jgi:hypothetical protein
MNKFGTECNKTICRKMELVEGMVKDMRREMERFGKTATRSSPTMTATPWTSQ